MEDHMHPRFDAYVGETETQANEEQRRELDAARARFRIGTKLLRRRLAIGLTQQQLAVASGIAQADISRIEHGHANPTTATLDALGRPLGITLDFVRTDGVPEATEV
jgi:ribosome-binding protein aMBF1 (putative translation factor)